MYLVVNKVLSRAQTTRCQDPIYIPTYVHIFVMFSNTSHHKDSQMDISSLSWNLARTVFVSHCQMEK